MKKAFVTTTIHTPFFLEDYCKDFKEYGHNDVSIVVTTDKKTPHCVQGYCESLQEKYGIPILCLLPVVQDLWLQSNCPEYGKFLPYNCIQRRNVAILYAYKEGAEIIYTVDDDNFLETKDYIGNHRLGKQEMDTIISSVPSNWYNICDWLQDSDDRCFFPRGFSFKHRDGDRNAIRKFEEVNVMVNAGLWLKNPDIDAVTRMAFDLDIWKYKLEGSISLGKDIICPFNSQNTALHRSVIPAYCLGVGLGRYDDIVASYFVQRIAHHLGDHISFGLPLVKQKRNEHDLWKDLEEERVGMQLIDWIVESLYSISLEQSNYFDCTKELVSKFTMKVNSSEITNREHMKFLDNIVENYILWLDAVNSIQRPGLF